MSIHWLRRPHKIWSWLQRICEVQTLGMWKPIKTQEKVSNKWCFTRKKAVHVTLFLMVCQVFPLEFSGTLSKLWRSPKVCIYVDDTAKYNIWQIQAKNSLVMESITNGYIYKIFPYLLHREHCRRDNRQIVNGRGPGSVLWVGFPSHFRSQSDIISSTWLSKVELKKQDTHGYVKLDIKNFMRTQP